MINLSDKEEIGHKENIKKLNSEYENIEGLYWEKLEHYKNSRVRTFIPIFVMRDVLGLLKASLN